MSLTHLSNRLKNSYGPTGLGQEEVDIVLKNAVHALWSIFSRAIEITVCTTSLLHHIKK